LTQLLSLSFRKPLWLALVLVFSIMGESTSLAAPTGEFISPDHSLIAVITRSHKHKSGEAFVQVRTSAGTVVQTKSYISTDGEHGAIIEHAKWTPNSEFFVYSMYNSGGHQPIYSYVDYYSRKDKQIKTLTQSSLEILDPDFRIHRDAPNFIDVYGRRSESGAEGWIKINLGDR
jgi:hypothetical protein